LAYSWQRKIEVESAVRIIVYQQK